MSSEKKSSGIGTGILGVLILLGLLIGASSFIPAECARCEGNGILTSDNKSSGGPVTGPFHHTCGDCDGSGERSLFHAITFTLLGD
jgi:hypothetical protein